MELITLLMANWEILSGIIALILTWNKDAIMNKLNISAKKKEIEGSTSDNIDKNLKLYQTLLDDYALRKEAEDIREGIRITALEAKVDLINQEKANLEGKVTQISDENKELRVERDKKTWEVSHLREEIHEIKEMLGKALKQLEYYKNNSDLELPEDLQ